VKVKKKKYLYIAKDPGSAIKGGLVWAFDFGVGWRYRRS